MDQHTLIISCVEYYSCAKELPAPLAFLPVSLYNGQRGRCSRAEQWAFYLFYPAHLALLAAVTNLLL